MLLWSGNSSVSEHIVVAHFRSSLLNTLPHNSAVKLSIDSLVFGNFMVHNPVKIEENHKVAHHAPD